MAATIDLNADLAETPGDLDLIGIVTSANVACGAHAGDAATMRAACERAVAAGVAIGAHPGYPDRGSMGRAELGWPVADVVGLVTEQVAALAGVAAGAGGQVRYVKLHGALYHRAGRDRDLAEALAAALSGAGGGTRGPLGAPAGGPALLAEPGSALLTAGSGHGLAVATEGYCDRAYTAAGGLVPRGEPGAVLVDPEAAAAQAESLALLGGVTAADGSWLPRSVRSLCLHGDTPGAVEAARLIRARLEAAGVDVAPFAM